MYFSQRKRKTFRRISIGSFVLLIAYVLLSSARRIPESIYTGLVISELYPFGRPTTKQWDLLYHLGGNGPWIPYRSYESQRENEILPGCVIEQAHMISRHAERFPTVSAGTRHLAVLERLFGARDDDKAPVILASSAWSFLSNWTYFTDTNHPEFESLTSTGPYAGVLQAYNTGRKLRARYDHLVRPNQSIDFWSCASARDVATARRFGQGFFGPQWEEDGLATLHVIPETPDRGGNTLTPGRSCPKYRTDNTEGRVLGYKKLAEFQAVMSRLINRRFRKEIGGWQFSPTEIFSMMEMCGFEILARGSSPWCDVFTPQEWLHFEYARDLLHFYRAGPGNRFASAMGWLWLNATKEILTNDSARGVYFSFVHDGDIMPLLATMRLFDEPSIEQYLPSTHVDHNRRWRTSDVVPMGGRLIFEKIACSNDSVRDSARQRYVRLLINDGVVDMRDMIGEHGPVGHVELDQFERWVDQRGREVGDFREMCGLKPDVAARIAFLRQEA